MGYAMYYGGVLRTVGAFAPKTMRSVAVVGTPSLCR
jgi:hypothetical protein